MGLHGASELMQLTSQRRRYAMRRLGPSVRGQGDPGGALYMPLVVFASVLYFVSTE